MSKVQKTIKVSNELNEAAQEWIKSNGNALNFSLLTEMAIRKFITEQMVLEPVIIKNDEALDLASKAFKRHKSALDRMK